MRRILSWLTAWLAALLEPEEREAVLGDIAESGRSAPRALRDVTGLVLRRQVQLWRTAQPWLAAAGLVVPFAMFFWGNILAVPIGLETLVRQGVLVEHAMTPVDEVIRLVGALLLLVGWAGIAGFVQGAAFRRSAGVYAGLLCILWLQPYNPLHPPVIESVLLVTPFLLGVRQGVRASSAGLRQSIGFAAAMMMLIVIMQVEDSRHALAFQRWEAGANWSGQWAWTPRPMPFLAILWQFGLVAVARIRIKVKNA